MTDSGGRSISRRTVLKGAGAGAGLTWAAPGVRSLKLAASTTSGHPTTGCTTCGPDHCLDQPLCGPVGPTLPECRCSALVAGGCACVKVGLCSGPLVPACGPTTTCPPGTVCVYSCCPTPVCLPLCLSA